MVFLGALWFSLFFGVMVLLVLIVDTAIDGSPRFDSELITDYDSILRPEEYRLPGRHPGQPLADAAPRPARRARSASPRRSTSRSSRTTERWCNRLIEVNLQNLAAVPSIVYGLLAVAADGAASASTARASSSAAPIALALLILPVIIITTREAVRAVPQEIRHGSLALGATVWQTTWRQTLPSAVPGIATGTILGLSRAIGEAAPLLVLGVAGSVGFYPVGPDQPVHGAADPDLQPLVAVAGGAPQSPRRPPSSSCWSWSSASTRLPSSSATSSSEPGRSPTWPVHPATATTRQIRRWRGRGQHVGRRPRGGRARAAGDPAGPGDGGRQAQRVLRRLPRRPRREPPVRQATRSPR